MYVEMSFAQLVRTVVLQPEGERGRLRVLSAPQRGSFASSQANIAGEFLYLVTIVLTYFLNADTIVGL